MADKNERTEETKIENAAVSKKEIEIAMIKTYCGQYGIYHAGKKVKVSEKIAKAFIDSGDAKKC